MITILHGGGSLGTPKSDYVICARPLMVKMFPTQNAESSKVAFVVTVLCAETVTLIVV